MGLGCRQWRAFIQLLGGWWGWRQSGVIPLDVIPDACHNQFGDAISLVIMFWSCMDHMNVFPSSKVSHFVCKRLADNESGYWGCHNTFTTREDFYIHNLQVWETVRTCKMIFISFLFAFIFRAHFFSPSEPHNYTFCGGLKVGNKMVIHFQNLWQHHVSG